ncbi:hypothetical protein ACH5RR_025384 [Cinchona calisaya]|uniref:Non-specific lipid-transfer protein n=1 Tax=Cinchona calisaya TaxID=153742 RepID=A0ABD2YZH4_9GENT
MANPLAVLLKLVNLLFLFMLVNSPRGLADISCGTVAHELTPCVPYVEKGQGDTTQCCDKIKELVRLASTTPDRQSVCKCLESFAPHFTDAQIQNAAELPGICKVFIPYPIKRDLDCSR